MCLVQTHTHAHTDTFTNGAKAKTMNKKKIRWINKNSKEKTKTDLLDYLPTQETICLYIVCTTTQTHVRTLVQLHSQAHIHFKLDESETKQ